MRSVLIFGLFIAAKLFGASAQFSQLPLAFEPNRGQFTPEVQFASQDRGLKLSVTGSGVRIQTGNSTGAETIWMRWKNGATGAQAEGETEMPGRSNYLIGADPARWKTGIASYRKVCVHGIYPGIDLVLYGNGNELEYDLALAPGADAHRIALEFNGARHLRKLPNGELMAEFERMAIRQHRPRVYQKHGNRQVQVKGEYILLGHSTVGFRLGLHQRSEPLVIDPVLSFSSVFGGSGTDTAQHVALDASGNIYVVGSTTSLDFPLANSFQSVPPGQNAAGNPAHIFVTKLDPTGSTVIFSTYLGGSSGETGRKIAVNANGNVYVAGSTVSSDFPVTASALSSSGIGNGMDDITLTELSASGSSLVFSIAFGGIGDDEISGLAVDNSGNCYLSGTTNSPDFPTTAQAHNDLAKLNTTASAAKAFAMKVNSGGTSLIYSAVLGGSGVDSANSLAVDSSGAAYLAGVTTSFDFPVTQGAYQATGNVTGSNTKGFITKLSADGSALQFSTYLGGSAADGINDIKLDAAGNIYVTGLTTSPDFPHPPSSYFSPYSGGSNAVFLSKFSATGSSLIYSAIFGGVRNTLAGLAVDSNGQAMATGSVDSNFPVKAGAVQIYPGSGSNAVPSSMKTAAFVIKLNGAGTDSVYSTYLGGGSTRSTAIAADNNGAAVITGVADSTFPVTPGAYQSVNRGQVFVAKIADASTCTYTVQALTTLSASVTTQSGCQWIAVSGVPWLGVTTLTAAGTGSGTVQLIASQNTGISRSGVVSIAGSLFTVNQPSGCQISLSSNSQSFTLTGGTGQFSAFTASGCSLPTAATNASWIHLTSAASPYRYTVDQNSSGQVRTGTITVGSLQFTVTEGYCSYSFSVSQTSFNALAHTAVAQITTQSGCAWSASSSTPAWITFSTSGVGSSAVTLTLQQNSSNAVRTGSIRAAGSTVAITQTTFTPNPRNTTYPTVWRPTGGNWYVSRMWNTTGMLIRQWGLNGDTPIPSDYDGDGRTDIAVWRPANGTWYIVPTSSPNNSGIYQWGLNGDVPVPGDYDGGGQTDLAVWRPVNGTWYVQSTKSSTRIIQQWGLPGDVPVPGDYDGDGKTDFAVWRPANGTWYVMLNGTGKISSQQWGLPGDIPVPGDYDGDGKIDFAVWRPVNGTWYVQQSSSGVIVIQQWGLNGDTPVPGDYDGDGKTDFAVWRPANGTWYVQQSSSDTILIQQWGLPGDIPIKRTPQ
jgi:hypothetical protein